MHLNGLVALRRADCRQCKFASLGFECHCSGGLCPATECTFFWSERKKKESSAFSLKHHHCNQACRTFALEGVAACVIREAGAFSLNVVIRDLDLSLPQSSCNSEKLEIIADESPSFSTSQLRLKTLFGVTNPPEWCLTLPVVQGCDSALHVREIGARWSTRFPRQTTKLRCWRAPLLEIHRCGHLPCQLFLRLSFKEVESSRRSEKIKYQGWRQRQNTLGQPSLLSMLVLRFSMLGSG